MAPTPWLLIFSIPNGLGQKHREGPFWTCCFSLTLTKNFIYNRPQSPWIAFCMYREGKKLNVEMG